VQVSPAQQASLSAPQPPQLPPLQVPPIEQADPSPVHRLPTQQPPPVQLPVSQHGWPGPPQSAHTPLPPPWHTESLPHTRPPQHARPAPPQSRQIPSTHEPLPHASPAQQLSPSAPQATPASMPAASTAAASTAAASIPPGAELEPPHASTQGRSQMTKPASLVMRKLPPRRDVP
jgi:hypothetical protein